jgi:hypothetical protein
MGQGCEGLACPQCGHEKVDKEFSTFAGASASGGGASTGGGCSPSGRFT